MMSTNPCKIFVLPLLSDSMILKSDSKNITEESVPIPSAKGKSIHKETNATTGIVKLILAKAEPKERFKLFCILFAKAAFTADMPSGSNTTQAMMIPDKAGGAPILWIQASKSGAKDSANKTTAVKFMGNNIALNQVAFLPGLSCTSCSSSAVTKSFL